MILIGRGLSVSGDHKIRFDYLFYFSIDFFVIIIFSVL